MSQEEMMRYRGGNIYEKYTSKNPITRWLIKRFFIDLDKMLNSISINSVLEVGCGEGYVTKHLHDYNNNLYVEGIDISDEIIAIAKKLHLGINFSLGSIYKMEYKDSSFDLIMAIEVLEHLEDPEKAINEMKRVSKKYAIITVPNEPLWRICNILRLAYLKRLGNTPGHVQHWNKRTLKTLLQKHFGSVTVNGSTLWLFSICEIRKSCASLNNND